MHIHAPNGTAETYPYSIGQLRKDNPQTSFPRNPSDELLAEWNVYPVTPTPQPIYNPDTHRISEAPPQQVNGVWVQAWLVEALTQDEIAANLTAWRQDMTVSPLQMRRALRQQGLLDAVLAYVAQQDADTQDAWEYAIEIRRTDALITQAAAALGKTEAEVDDLFRLAASY